MGRCNGITKAGAVCPFPATHGDYCPSHVPDPMLRHQLAAERGRAGQAAREASKAAVRASIADKQTIRTIEGQLSTLDAVLRDVLKAKMDAGKRAAAIVGVVKCAREVLTAAELEQENVELRQLIEEKFPDLKKHMKHLKAIP